MRLWIYFAALWATTLVYAQQCRISGQVFFADAVDNAITIKTDSGELVNFTYDRATKFVNGETRLQPEELNNGDRLCVGTSQPLVVTVTARREISTEQQKELSEWQADSLY